MFGEDFEPQELPVTAIFENRTKDPRSAIGLTRKQICNLSLDLAPSEPHSVKISANGITRTVRAYKLEGENQKPAGIYVGKDLAEEMSLRIGDEIEITI